MFDQNETKQQFRSRPTARVSLRYLLQDLEIT
jgi:hypothetical protein